MITYNLFLFNLPLATILAIGGPNNSGRLGEFIAFSHVLSAPEIFIPDVYGTKNRSQKPAPQYGVDLIWRRLLRGAYVRVGLIGLILGPMDNSLWDK